MKQYDYLIVGAGLFGAVFAHEAKKAGKKCLVIDKRDHIAGNIYTENVEGINVHRYGAHIFHTNNKAVWQYVNQFAEFNRYTNSPVANYHGEIYNLPFNMNTFNKMWGVVTPAEAKAKIEEQKAAAGITDPQNAVLPKPEDLEALDASPVRTLDKTAEQQMIARIDEAKENADTLGGVIEVVVYGVPAGIGTYVESDRRLDAALASAVMGVQAIKGVEIGDGFLEAMRPGSQAHDEMVVGDDGRITRLSNRAGGIEGGMSNGQPIVVRAAMKPIPSIPKALRTVDVTTGEAAQAINQRSDNTAVPAAAVVAEAMVRLTIAQYVLEKFGGDSVAETKRNAESYVASWPEHMR